MNFVHVSFFNKHICNSVLCNMYVFFWKEFFEIGSAGLLAVKFIVLTNFTAPAANEIVNFSSWLLRFPMMSVPYNTFVDFSPLVAGC